MSAVRHSFQHLRFLVLRILLLVVLFAPGSDAETLSVVAHIHSPVSGGQYEPDEIAVLLAERGLDAGIITDHDHLEVRWGLPFFRDWLGFTYRLRSIATEGADRYAASIRSVAARVPEVILLPGVEANPYYRIEFDWRCLCVRVLNLHEHILAMGLSSRDLGDTPSIANGFHSSPERPITQYQPDAGARPYQLFIDWVAEHGGLTFWTHPGVNEVIQRVPFEITTRPYYDHVARTDRYTGLEDFGRAVAGPGGMWDRLLAEYQAGVRSNPPWFLAQADFKGGDPDQLLDFVNYVEVEERTEKGLLEALRVGRFYATQVAVGLEWRLESFRVSDGTNSAGSGGLLETSSPIRITARFTRLSPRAHALTAELIRQGVTIASARLEASVEHTIEDSAPAPGERRYYRLTAGRPERLELLTNPIFVRGKPARAGTS